MKINPYLHYDGNCGEAFQFYVKALGGKDLVIMTFADAPPGAAPPGIDKNQVMHARFQLGDTTIMGSDSPGEYNRPQGFSVSIVVDAPEQADRIFAALSEGGDVKMAIAETFWAQRFGMVTDRFGIPWMVNCEKPMP